MSETYDQREALYEVRQQLPDTCATDVALLKRELLRWKEAYYNMRDFAVANGLDVTTKGNK